LFSPTNARSWPARLVRSFAQTCRGSPDVAPPQPTLRISRPRPDTVVEQT